MVVARVAVKCRAVVVEVIRAVLAAAIVAAATIAATSSIARGTSKGSGIPIHDLCHAGKTGIVVRVLTVSFLVVATPKACHRLSAT